MDFNQQKYDKKAKKMIYYGVREIRALGFKTFAESVLVNTFHYDKKFINIVLQELVNHHKLIRVYRVYNSKDLNQYINFTNSAEIPTHGYITDKSKHLRFHVGKFTQVGIFYTFPKGSEKK